MSTLKTNNVQVGQSVTATNNFTLYQPATPDGTVRLGVGNSGATTADVITATSTGNVGIGVTPTVTAGVTELALGSASTNPRINGVRDGASAFLIYSDSSGMDVYERRNLYLRFGTNNTERARIDSSGRLLINLTSSISSQAVLQVQQNCLAGVMTEFNDTDTTSSNNIIRFRKNGTEAGKIAVTTSNTTQYVTSSDYRLKEDVKPMLGALAKVQALKPVTYKWKINGAIGEGFIAHELQAVVPDCVTGEKDAVETYTDEEGNEQTRPVYQGIDTSFLVATLTAAIQELKAELDSVKAELATLKNG